MTEIFRIFSVIADQRQKTQKPFRKLLKGIRREAQNPNILIMPELTIQPPISHIRMFLAETACLLIRYLIFSDVFV